MATSSAQTAAALSASFASSAAMNAFAAERGSATRGIIEDMRHARALLPYLAAAAVIAAGSTALVLQAVDTANPPGSVSSDTTRAAPQLSSTGRLAYWRQNPAGAFVLWPRISMGPQHAL